MFLAAFKKWTRAGATASVFGRAVSVASHASGCSVTELKEKNGG
jgi:hypothetical protein